MITKRLLSLIRCTTGIALLGLLFMQQAHAQQRPVEQILRVQLLWHHQTQFAGFYVAQARRHFEAEGLDVVFHQGGPGLNPITELQEGRADIAVSWLANAWGLTAPGKRVTNVAQIFSGSSLAVVCRISAGVYTPKDIEGKKVGVWNLGDEFVVREMLRRLAIPPQSVELFAQRAAGRDLIEGVAPCVTAMTYNEYWKILEAGVPPTDLIVVSPELFSIPHVEDGLYVLSDRLKSPEFRDQLARFVRALRQGWQEARIAPTLAIETVQRLSPSISKEHQRHMLETVLAVTPEPKSFGLFDLGRYENSVATMLAHSGANSEPPEIWTHAVWNQLCAMEGKAKPLTAATRFYASGVLNMVAFKMLIVFGVLTFALSGALEAINRNYDIWGRLVLAFLSGLGGGTIRDLLIGDERMPFYYVTDPVLPIGILTIVLASTAITAHRPEIHKTNLFKSIKKYADIFGFAVLATTGALIAIASSMPWYWAPICGALTCAGGGMLRDIVVNQEPATFKGVIYEEVAVLGALLLIAGLVLANQFERSALPVYVSVTASILLIIMIRLLIYRFDVRYPPFLGGTSKA